MMAGLECARCPVVKRITEERVEVRAFNVMSRSEIACTFGVKAALHAPLSYTAKMTPSCAVATVLERYRDDTPQSGKGEPG